MLSAVDAAGYIDVQHVLFGEKVKSYQKTRCHSQYNKKMRCGQMQPNLVSNHL